MLGSDGADVALDAGARDAAVAPAGVPGADPPHPVTSRIAMAVSHPRRGWSKVVGGEGLEPPTSSV